MQKRLKMKTLNCFFGNAISRERERERRRERRSAAKCRCSWPSAASAACCSDLWGIPLPLPVPVLSGILSSWEHFMWRVKEIYFCAHCGNFQEVTACPLYVHVCMSVCVLRLDNALTTRSMSAGWVAWKADESWLKRPKTLGLRHPFNGAYD